jgi:hypothetical protein
MTIPETKLAIAVGAKLEKAIELASFDMGQFTAFNKDNIEPSSVEVAFQRLIISLDKYESP